MQAFLYEAGRLTTKTNYLIPVLARAFAGQTGCEAGTLPRVLAFTGSGGKTSLMGRLAWEARQDGKKVLIATTTHMARPNQYATLTDDAQAIIRQLQQEGVVIAGLPAGEKKISFIGQAAYDRACAAADLVLVEADGSRRLPLKAFGPAEPVLPANTQAVLCVAGLSALGQNLADVFFRLDEAERQAYENVWTVPPDVLSALSADRAAVTPPLLAYLWQQGCLRRLATDKSPGPAIPVLPVLNQADTVQACEQAQEIFDSMTEPVGLITSLRIGGGGETCI
jgi:xanthine dehydrogenase accessory factor